MDMDMHPNFQNKTRDIGKFAPSPVEPLDGSSFIVTLPAEGVIG